MPRGHGTDARTPTDTMTDPWALTGTDRAAVDALLAGTGCDALVAGVTPSP